MIYYTALFQMNFKTSCLKKLAATNSEAQLVLLYLLLIVLK
jgi:hypothetical protein